MSKYNYNKDYFEKIDTEDKAYWLGFLYADGCINRLYRNEKLSNMNLEIGLCKEDTEHLNKFSRCIESNVPIKNKINTYKGHKYESSRLIICSKKMCYDLWDKGCTPQKTYTIKFPDNNIVPDKFIRDFIRGYFDGDGCIYVNEKTGRIEVTITGMFDMLNGISNFLISKKILRVKPKLYKDKRSEANTMYIYGKDSIKEILDYLYKDSNIYLDRKYAKYIEFYNGYDDEYNKRGVYFDKNTDKYIATIRINGKSKRLGSFNSFEDALECRKNAEIEKMNLLNMPT